MRARLRFEIELAELLESRGYRCIRSAGSRGPADLFAINSSHVRLIQVKSTIRLDRPGNSSVFRRAIEQLKRIPCPQNVTRELWVKPLRSGWRYLVVDDLPDDKDGIDEILRRGEWTEA